DKHGDIHIRSGQLFCLARELIYLLRSRHKWMELEFTGRGSGTSLVLEMRGPQDSVHPRCLAESEWAASVTCFGREKR
ncbi:MAG: hypothetical protein AAGI44_09990, partial [Pseudomonadota bacterium]